MSNDGAGRALSGRRIALLEMREAERLAAMFRRQGAEVLAYPLVGIADPADPSAALAWLDRFAAAPCDDLVLLTGEGLHRLLGLARRAGIEPGFVAALARTRTITRGPKPAQALRTVGLRPALRAAEPTTAGIIALLAECEMRGRRVGVQFYPGAASGSLIGFLAEKGAIPDPVTPYEYAPQMADGAVWELIVQLAAGEIDIVVFTSAAQVRRLFGVARERGREGALEAALQKTVVAAVGPVVAAALRQHAVVPTIVPSKTFLMKPLVSAIAASDANRTSG